MALTEKWRKLWEELHPKEENKKNWEEFKNLVHKMRKSCKD